MAAVRAQVRNGREEAKPLVIVLTLQTAQRTQHTFVSTLSVKKSE